MGWKSFSEGLVVFLSSFSLTFCISTYLGEEIPLDRAAAVLLLFTLWFMAVCCQKRTALILVPASLLVWGYQTCRYRESILEGKDFLWLMFPAVLLLSIAVYIYKSSIVQILITVLLVGVFLATDLYSDEWAIFLWAASFAAGRCIRREGGEVPAVLLLAGSFLILTCAQRFISPAVSGVLREHSGQVRYFQQSLNMRVDSFISKRNSSAIIDGTIDNSSPGGSDETELVVYLDKRPGNSIYLKGFVGDGYASDAWEEISDEEFYAAAGAYFGQTSSGFDYELVKTQLFDAYYMKYQGTLSEMVIEFVNYNGRYTLYPYGAVVNSQENLYADGEIIRQGETRVRYTFTENMELHPDTFYQSDLTEQFYEEYVYGKYLSVGKKLENLEQLCADLDNSGFSAARNAIRNYLTDNCTYSVELMPVPYESDFVEFFVFTQKKGYCTHFAAAATLMFRMMGYPARFVTGYVVFPSDFVRDENGGYAAEVTGKNAHAWTEVYIDGVWYPVEMTPGYIAAAPELSENDSEQEAAAEPDTAEETVWEETNPAEPETAEENENEGDGQNLRLPLILSIVLLSVLALALLLCVRRAFAAVFNQNRFRGTDYRKTVRECAVYTFQMLDRAGRKMTPGMTDTEYAERIPAEGFDKFVETAQRACFSNDMITEEDAAYCIAVKHRLQEELYRELGGFRRLLWKYFYCY